MSSSPQSAGNQGPSSKLVASPSIDLPKGGGALRGIDEKFRSNPATGSASFSIPLPLSPSRGFEPEISLSYDSGSGNGPFGLGWSLSVPDISRKTDKGLPQYIDGKESDVFILSGSEDLVPTGEECEKGGYRICCYRPRIESGFARIERWTNAKGIPCWRTISSDNVIRIYGETSNARISDPNDERRVFKWFLEFSHDGKGNAVSYTYESDGSNRYLKNVRYGNKIHFDGAEQPSDYHFELEFAYGSRPDPFSTYRSGFEIRCGKRCEKILMHHSFAAKQLVRSVAFTYGQTGSDISLLTQAKQTGYMPDGSFDSLPAMTFTYQPHEWGAEFRDVDPDSLRGLLAGLSSIGSAPIDLYNEGLPGVLSEVDHAWYYKRNLGEGRLGPSTLIPFRPSTGGAAGIQELEADSEKYLVNYGGASYRFDSEGSWNPCPPMKSVPNINFGSPWVRMLDLDGDGRADLLLDEGTSFLYFRSEGKDGFTAVSRVSKGANEDEGPMVAFADYYNSIFLADMSGDGLTDIVRVRNGSVCYWPNLGHGKFGSKVEMADSPVMDHPRIFNAKRARLADVDGTGAADLIYTNGKKFYVWLNRSGNGFAKAREIPLSFICDDASNYSVMDFLGKGTACIVWSSPHIVDSRRPMRYIDLMGGRKPHLMTGYSNGMGKTVELEYAPSTKFYLADRNAGRPWVTKLPFPVHCLSKVTARDHVSGHAFASTYAYHHGYYDIPEREFRGFGRVDQIDAESFGNELDQPPVLKKTWFHLGAWIKNKGMLEHYETEYFSPSMLEQPVLDKDWNPDERREAMRAFKGMPLREEIYALDGSELESKPYATTEFSYNIKCLQAKGENRHAVFHAVQSESLMHHYERSTEDPRVAHSLALEYDKYGRPTISAEAVYGRETGYDEQKKQHVVVKETQYAEDAGGKIGDGFFRMGVECTAKTWELTGIPLRGGVPEGRGGTIFKPAELLAAFSNATPIPFETDPAQGLQKRLVEHAETLFYDENLSEEPLELGEMARHGLPYESYTLSHTTSLLSHIYDGRVTSDMLAEGGFAQRGSDWWARSGRNTYDGDAASKFYLPSGVENAFGAKTEIEYDEHNLLATSVTDPLGNAVTAINDYRTLSPKEVTDPNGNKTAVETDALGIVVATAAMGKNGEGDTLANPTAKMEYGFAVPSWVRTRSRETHGDPGTRWLEMVEYSDGMGRVALAKTKAEPDKDGNERWVGTGRTVLNNKGNPVKQYEPYFSGTDAWETEPEIREQGVTPIMHYDPLSRLVRTDFPDGTHSKAEFTAWEQKDFDRCDTAEGNPHFDTPTVTHLDSLGRAFCVVADDGVNKLATKTELDIEGNEKKITDARGNTVMEYKYGIHGEKGYTKSMDAGERWMLLAADGQPMYAWDSRGHKLRVEYDELRRPVKQWLNDETLVGMTVYGEDADSNLIGQPWKIYDQSGMTENVRFDFKGNLLESKRRFTVEYKNTISWDVADPNILLLGEEFVSKTEYDALNRATNLLTPHNAAIPASEIMPAYDEGGLLKSVNAKLRGATEETDFVEKISYNPKGQRTRIRYGNGATTKYTYDEKTFRLTQLFTTRENGTNVLQDLNYTYDPVGNITEIRDDAQDVVFFDNQIVNPSQKFEYDALYRLIKVTGREHAGNEADTDFENDGYPNAHTSIPNDTAALRRYTREWEYDEVGNILEMIHTANNSNWNRMYSYASSNNRLNSTAVGQTTVNYTYNSHGSMASMPHLQAMEWDFAERLRHITKGTTEAYYNYDGSGERVRKVVEKNGVIETRLYLGGFEIFRKRNGNVLELERETLHVMDSFEYNELEENEKDNEAIEIKNNASRITKNKRRIAIVETKTWENNIQVANPILVQRYQLSNNIESVTLELNESADIISYEEYYPYGDTSYQAGTSEVSKKRYRYTGKEKDEESGLYYFHARYYSSMIGIFISVDPKFEKYPNVSSYAYCMNNPVKYIDPDGKEIKLEGTAAEQEAILSNLQKLTNDKLGMRSNDDGTSTVIIKKIGGERTKKYLKLGSELIRDLNKKGDGAKIVTIKIGTNESWAYPADTNEDRANAENGIGGNAIIEFDMTTVVDVLTTNSGFSSEIKTVSREKMPNKINLAHELIHASNINKGVVGSFEKKLHGYRTNRGVRFEMVSIDELYTMGIENSINPSVSKYAGRRFTENKIRKEHGLNLRVAYK